MRTLVPPIPHRFDHLEIATSDLAATEALFGRLGFCSTQERYSESLDQKLMIQGRVRVLLSMGREGSYQYDYCQKNGEGICAIGYHVDSAKKALHLLRQQKSEVAQDFLNDETDEMFFQSSAVHSVGDIRVVFVTRSGAPHDVLSPYAPGFTKIAGAKPELAVGLMEFSSIIDPEVDRILHVTFTCADSKKTKDALIQAGFEVMGESAHLVLLFKANKTTQVMLHFRKS